MEADADPDDGSDEPKEFRSIIERAEFLPKAKIVRKKKFRWKSQMVKSWAENTHRRRTAPSCVNSLRLSFSHPSLDTCNFCLNRLSVLPEMNEKREHVSQARLNLAEWVILVFQQKEPKYFSKIFGPKFGTQSQCRSQNFHKSVTLSTRNFAPFRLITRDPDYISDCKLCKHFLAHLLLCLSTLLFYEAGPPRIMNFPFRRSVDHSSCGNRSWQFFNHSSLISTLDRHSPLLPFRMRGRPRQLCRRFLCQKKTRVPP